MNTLDLTVLKIRCDGGRSHEPARLEHEDRDGRSFAVMKRDAPDNHRGHALAATIEELKPGHLELVIAQVAIADAKSGRYLPQRRTPDADARTAKTPSRIDLTADNPFTRQNVAACPCGESIVIRRSEVTAALAAGKREIVLPHQRH